MKYKIYEIVLPDVDHAMPQINFEIFDDEGNSLGVDNILVSPSLLRGKQEKEQAKLIGAKIKERGKYLHLHKLKHRLFTDTTDLDIPTEAVPTTTSTTTTTTAP